MTATATRAEVKFQARDFAIMRGLFESRIMTAQHIAALYFDGRPDATKKRLQKLKSGGVIRERPRKARDPAILFLTKRGFKALKDHGQLSDYPKLTWDALDKRARVSELTVRHELEVMNVKAAMAPAINRTQNLSVVEFSTWPLLFQFEARRSAIDPTQGGKILVKPDGFIRVHERQPDGSRFEQYFFLEVDRSTETQETLAQKALCYLDYFKRGGLAARFGHPNPAQAYKEFPFRVLMVFRNAERRNNAAERLLLCRPPILSLVWLSTSAEVTDDPMSAIWITPREYRTVTENTAFDAQLRRDAGWYRRQPEREAMVERSVRKLKLFEA
jgi:hypothetical protein